MPSSAERRQRRSSRSSGVLAPSPARQGPGPIPPDTLRRLGLTLRRRVAGRLPGGHPTRGIAADGTELAQLQAYVPGDDVRRIDPAASARTGEPHVRRLVPERAVTTWVVADVSPSMAFGTVGRLKSDVAEGVVDVVARLATQHGGSVGLALAADGAPVLPPATGCAALAAVRRAAGAGVLADGAGGGQLGPALERVARLARMPGMVVVVSDFRDDDGWAGPLRHLAARHAVVAVEVRDPFEAELPDAGLLVLSDPETGEVVEVDTSDARLRALLAQAEAGRRARVHGVLRSCAAQHVELRTDQDWLRELGRVLR
jgi:uncharacterized protein (DUF58 family)